MSRRPWLFVLVGCVAVALVAGDRETAAGLVGFLFLMACIAAGAKA